VCASAEVSTYWDGSQTHVAIRMRNWSGIRGTAPDGIGRAISWIGFRGPGPNDIWNTCRRETPPEEWFCPLAGARTTSTIGPVAPVNFASLGWIQEDSYRLWFGSINGNGVLGCELGGWDKPWEGGLSTCADPRVDSWVVLSFTTSWQWSAAEVPLRMMAARPSTYGYGEEQFDLAVVPEPITVSLLATGLAALGGARLVRRRKTPSPS
jgi:hypothetical protein